MKLSMKHLGHIAVSLMSFFRRGECADVCYLALDTDARLVSRDSTFGSFHVNPLGKVVIAINLIPFVLAILLWSGDSEIVPSVIEGVPISVVQQSPRRHINTLHCEDDSVNRWEYFLSSNLDFNPQAEAICSAVVPVHLNSGRFSGSLFVVANPSVVPLEMGSGPFLPSQNSSLIGVGKTFVKEFTGWQFNEFFHARVSYSGVS
jgi:hypothetical protein